MILPDLPFNLLLSVDPMCPLGPVRGVAPQCPLLATTVGVLLVEKELQGAFFAPQLFESFSFRRVQVWILAGVGPSRVWRLSRGQDRLTQAPHCFPLAQCMLLMNSCWRFSLPFFRSLYQQGSPV